MSQESLSLIKSMLQVDPKKRITVNELLSHPWLTLGILDPVKIRMENSKCYDTECVNVMAKYHQVDSNTIWNHIKKWKYDYHTATYFLLLGKKKRGSSLKLCSSMAKFAVKIVGIISFSRQTMSVIHICLQNETPNKYIQNISGPDLLAGNKKTPLRITSTPKKEEENTPATPKTEDFSSPLGFIEPRKPSSIRKPQKRIRSPGPDDSSPGK